MTDKKPNILFVDDDELTIKSLETLMKKISRNCYFASDGVEALEIYKKHNIDVVLSDINMPKMNGIKLATEIKKINPNQSIILVTAYNDTEYLHDAIELNVDGYVTKPVLVDKLFAKISESYEKITLKRKVKLQEKIIIQQEKLASMGEMIGNIAHQWRQPLNSMGSLITTMHLKYDNDTLDSEFFEKFFEKSDFLIQKMSDTIDDFMYFFKPDKAKQYFKIEDLINETINMFKNSSVKDTIFNVEIRDSLEVQNFKSEIKQVILNLFKNSVDAYSENGIEEIIIDIECYEENAMAIISVQDYAGGIKKEVLNRIFEPYFTTKHKDVGAGIGLYMCKMIIESSAEGFIDIKNNKSGVLTTISLPLKD